MQDGLSIAQRIVTALGGEIEVDSHAGNGTTVRVLLTATAAPAPDPAPTSRCDAPYLGRGPRGAAGYSPSRRRSPSSSARARRRDDTSRYSPQ